MIGKDVRLERILNRKNRKTVIVPMDHGVTVGPILGIENLSSAVDKISEGGANAVILHKGNIKRGHRKSGKDIDRSRRPGGWCRVAPGRLRGSAHEGGDGEA